MKEAHLVENLLAIIFKSQYVCEGKNTRGNEWNRQKVSPDRCRQKRPLKYDYDEDEEGRFPVFECHVRHKEPTEPEYIIRPDRNFEETAGHGFPWVRTYSCAVLGRTMCYEPRTLVKFVADIW